MKGKGNTSSKLHGKGQDKAKSEMEGQRQIEEQRQKQEQRKEHKLSEEPSFRETRHGKTIESRSTWRQRNIKRNIPSMDNKVIKLFAEILEGATTQDLLSLFELKKDTTRRSYIHDNSARSVHRSSGNTIPSLVLWT